MHYGFTALILALTWSKPVWASRLGTAYPKKEKQAKVGGVKKLTALAAVLLLFRLVSVVTIAPLNAPDEVGHMVMVTALARGELLTLENEHQYKPAYSYALFHPAPYVPYAAGLWLASRIDPSLLDMEHPKPQFKSGAVLAARLGGLVWFAVFAVFLLLLVHPYRFSIQLGAFSTIGLLPQITYTQSYVNLDAMGVSVMAMLVWALRKQNLAWIAFSVVLLMTSKLNYYCLLPLPLLILNNLRTRALVLATGIFSVVPWFYYNYTVNTAKYGSLLGFSALSQIYPDPPGGAAVLSRTFLGLSLNSAFGVFGYFTQAFPTPVFWIWKLLLLPTGLYFLTRSLLQKSTARPWHLGFASVVVANFFMHYWASFSGAMSPQGRYLFPASCILMGYLIHGVRNSSRSLSAITVFFWVCALGGIYLGAVAPPR